MESPKIDNAPGLKWRKIKAGWQAIWRCRADIIRKGYAFKSCVIWQSTPERSGPPDDIAKMFIADRCRALQHDMHIWADGGIPEFGAYDGTWKSLIRCYKTDPDSPYHKKEYATRGHYDTLCRRIEKEIGTEKIKDTDIRRLLRLHESITAPDEDGGPGKTAMGHAIIGMMRTITTFGVMLLKCDDCKALRPNLKDMRIENAKPRVHHLTADQVIAIRETAHRMTDPYRHSLALAQAMQFDIGSGVRQKDIIGEWVPISEPGVSDIISGNDKWVKGIRGEEIDENFILRHITSKRKKLLVADLTLAPMVMEEFRKMAGLRADEQLERHHVPLTGPLVINEQTGQPWYSQTFRAAWREVARAAGVPDEVRNMDSRAGAITEALSSGASLDAVRKGATHSNSSMTQRYSRGDAEAVSEVMQFRSASRKKAPK